MAKKYLDENGIRYIWQRFKNKLIDSSQETVIFAIKNNFNTYMSSVKAYVYTYTTRDPESAEDSLILTHTFDCSTSKPITFQMPAGVRYRIKVDDVDGYAAPNEMFFIAVGGKTRNITYNYAACNITINITGAFPTDKLMVICEAKYIDPISGEKTNSSILSKGSAGSITFRMPYSHRIPLTITCEYIQGLRTPDTIVYTPIPNTLPMDNSHTFNLEYIYIPTEIKIMDGSGNLVDVDSWTSSMGSTGVALTTSNTSVVIAPDEWYSKYDEKDYPNGSNPWNGNKVSAWGGRDKVVNGVVRDYSVTYPSGIGEEIESNFNGSSNTDKIIAQLSGTVDDLANLYTGAPAAEYCRAYSNGCKGRGHWYLPAAGEVYDIYLNKSEIENALAKISATALPTGTEGLATSNQSYKLNDNGDINPVENYAYYGYWNNSYDGAVIITARGKGKFGTRYNSSGVYTVSTGFYVRPVCHI